MNPVGVNAVDDRGRAGRTGLVAGITLGGAVVFALLVRGNAVIGIAVLFLVFVPIERWFVLRPQPVFRRGFATDLTHLLVNGTLVTLASIGFVIVAAVPFLWVRGFDAEAAMPATASVVLGIVLVFVGNYWGHRLCHRIPLLWRFHSVHHSIEQMDWLASGRLHPLDSGFTQAFTVLPLFLLGYDAGIFAGVTVLLTLLALFQHANVRLRFPGLRWVLPTPEWHHWHHAIDAEARDTNFGLPVVDLLFGTAHLPKGRRPSGYGTDEPVPQDSYWRQLAHPFHRNEERVHVPSRITPSG
jgi:sterol desaturase/sphingolipid hydroxylase (fatty acid hydroxylase superfamily)